MPQMAQCPNFSVCQTMMPAHKRGNEHTYEVYNSTTGRMETKICPGG